MGSINLATKPSSDGGEFPYKKGIFSIIGVGILLGLAYWGMGFYGKKIEEKKKVFDAQYDSEKTILTGDKNRDIVDFQNRIISAKGLVGERFFAVESFAALEESIVPGAKLVSYDYEKKSLEANLNYVADNFSIMAKQILALKNSDFFSDVSLGKSGLDQDGKANFFVTLKINPVK